MSKVKAIKPRYIRKKAGTPPGSLIYTGVNAVEEAQVFLYQYDAESKATSRPVKLKDAFEHIDHKKVNWYNVVGVSDHHFIRIMGEKLHVHGLVLEDIMNVRQLPKYDEYNDYIFLCTKMLTLNETTGVMDQEQISFLLFDYCLVSLQEKPGDLFGPIRERIENPEGKIRQKDTDYLFYSLIDVLVDNYYLIIDYITDKVTELEEEIIYKPEAEQMQKILHLKKMVMNVRKIVVPFRESLTKLVRTDNEPVVTEYTLSYFNDVLDHTNHILDSITTAREILNGCMDLHMANLSNGLNQVMKTLTVISTIFIPLTFIAGVYGMNFDKMPELHWENGYYYSLAAMVVVAAVMFAYMKKKHWF